MIKHHFLSGLYLREAAIPAGQTIRMHRHKSDHMSVLVKGSVEAVVNGKRRELEAPAFLLVRKGEHHTVRAVTDVVWYCTHVTDETDCAAIDGVLIEADGHAV